MVGEGGEEWHGRRMYETENKRGAGNEKRGGEGRRKTNKKKMQSAQKEKRSIVITFRRRAISRGSMFMSRPLLSFFSSTSSRSACVHTRTNNTHKANVHTNHKRKRTSERGHKKHNITRQDHFMPTKKKKKATHGLLAGQVHQKAGQGTLPVGG